MIRRACNYCEAQFRGRILKLLGFRMRKPRSVVSCLSVQRIMNSHRQRLESSDKTVASIERTNVFGPVGTAFVIVPIGTTLISRWLSVLATPPVYVVNTLPDPGGIAAEPTRTVPILKIKATEILRTERIEMSMASRRDAKRRYWSRYPVVSRVRSTTG